jgi:2-keto-4-pentenoate hydratase/2-oxohepta-3-ene-1,7-dioic acid hydratase in catechol pathway
VKLKNIVVDGRSIYPSKVVCIGRNYVDHIKELNNEMPEQMVIFVKPNSALCNEIESAKDAELHYEGEISFVISAGKISAVGFGLDLTKRELQSTLKKAGLPWERAKGFDNSAVFSDFVSFDGRLEDLSLQLFINNSLIQEANFDLMIYKPQQILAEVSSFMSIADGDIVMTGTPKGVGPLFRDDQFTGRIYDGEQLIIEKQWRVL